MLYFEVVRRNAVAFASLGCLAVAVFEITILINPTLGDPASLVLLVVLATLFVGGLSLCFLCLLLKAVSRAGVFAFVGVVIAGWTIIHLYLLFHSLPYSLLGMPY